jgi:GNAT superfamily N-acetyltransferase
VKVSAPHAVEFALASGQRVRVRPIRPADKEKLVESLHRVSAQTRYRRFLSTRDSFTEGELRYLTEVDGEHHFALVAVALDEQGEESHGICSVRFVELPNEAGVAEPAIAVADDYQGRGVGTQMFARLIAAARERGIRSFHCELLASNGPMIHILDKYAPESERHIEGGVLAMRFDLPTA